MPVSTSSTPEGVSLDVLNLAGCDSLWELDISDTGIISLDLAGNTMLEILNAGSCSELEELNLAGCTGLRVLDISDCVLGNSDVFADCVNLVELYCTGNRFTYLELGGFEALEYVICGLQIAEGFKTGASVDLSVLVGGMAKNVSDVMSCDEKVMESEAMSYSPESGFASFSGAPAAVSYRYNTGFETDSGDLMMKVLLTHGEVISEDEVLGEDEEVISEDEANRYWPPLIRPKLLSRTKSQPEMKHPSRIKPLLSAKMKKFSAKMRKS